MHYLHPLVKPGSIELRDYQKNIAAAALRENTLVVLPTGMGKTVVALMVIADTLQADAGKVLFLAPTKPLVVQHAKFLNEHLLGCEAAVFTGEVAPARRDEIWRDSRIVVSTPQVISNDILSGKISLSDVSLLIFDEAHRAMGDYPYVFIGDRFAAAGKGRVLGMTASPGSSAAKIEQVCRNIGAAAMELRTEYDADVVNYTHTTSMSLVEVEMTDGARRISDVIRRELESIKRQLQKHGLALSPKPLGMRELLAAQASIRERLHSGARQPALYHAISLAAMAMKLNQALEYAESQSIGALRNYIDRLEADAGAKAASKATKMLVQLPSVREIAKMCREVQAEHPKLQKTAEIAQGILSRHPDAKIIVFTHYRDISEVVARELALVPGARPVRFVGQATRGQDKGMRQKQQIETIGRFRSGEFNILVATSVAEEGLDIPATDFVIFYEPIPSEIRSIQRRGRTGRFATGRVYVLVTKGTRDEPYFWSSVSREKRMKKIIALKNELKGKIAVNKPGDATGGRPGALAAPIPPPSAPAMAPPAQPPIRRVLAAQEAPGPLLGRLGSPASLRLPDGAGMGNAAPDADAGGAVSGNADSAVKRGPGQQTLGSFGDPGPPPGADEEPGESVIVVDSRELVCVAAKELSKMGFTLKTRPLETGDYILSDRVAVERKEAGDFLSSLMDGRLFSQVRALRKAYQRPLLIVEGEGLFSERNIAEGAIYGALASIAVDYGIPVMFSKDGRETAQYLAAIRRREFAQKRAISIRGEKGALTTAERQQFIIEGLPGISATLAQRLLSHFGSVKAVADAGAQELAKVRGIGPQTAGEIVRVLTEKYIGKDSKKDDEAQ